MSWEDELMLAKYNPANDFRAAARICRSDADLWRRQGGNPERVAEKVREAEGHERAARLLDSMRRGTRVRLRAPNSPRGTVMDRRAHATMGPQARVAWDGDEAEDRDWTRLEDLEVVSS